MTKLTEKISKIVDLIREAEVDLEKFEEKGNNTAGTRVRKAMQEIKVKAQEIREGISDAKKGYQNEAGN
jgi:FtsZ-binding cell division protein ZapB